MVFMHENLLQHWLAPYLNDKVQARQVAHQLERHRRGTLGIAVELRLRVGLATILRATLHGRKKGKETRQTTMVVV